MIGSPIPRVKRFDKLEETLKGANFKFEEQKESIRVHEEQKSEELLNEKSDEGKITSRRRRRRSRRVEE